MKTRIFYSILLSVFLSPIDTTAAAAGKAQPVWKDSEWRKKHPDNCAVLKGNQCGCHHGYCWAYKFRDSTSGDPWCYTQKKGTPAGQKDWAKCSHTGNCYFKMTCGDDKVYFGSDEDHFTQYFGEADAQTLRFRFQSEQTAENERRERAAREERETQARREEEVRRQRAEA